MNEYNLIDSVKKKALERIDVDRQEGIELLEMCDSEEVLEKLFEASREVHSYFNQNRFNLCSIVSGKHGSCSEDCKFCAQSAHYNTGIETYGLKEYTEILGSAGEVEREGVRRFSIVTSGKKLRSGEFLKVVDQYRKLSKDTELHLCASHGTLGYEDMVELRESGVQMYHHNLETSRSHYEKICTTHSYDERLETIKSAKRAGLKVCSGGIFGMGESREDRIDMLYQLKALDVDSIPINILCPIPGTPLENMETISPMEVLKTIAVYRLVLPSVEIRYGGGRSSLGDYQKLGMKIGVNGMITGDYLTTTGSDMQRDKELLESEKLKLF